MKNRFVLLITAIAIFATMLTPTVFAAENDPYEGFLVTAFDSTTATGYSTANGRLTSSGTNKIYTYEDIDFGDETVIGVTMNIATDPAYAGSTVSLYLDKSTGTPVAKFTVVGNGWSAYSPHYCAIDIDIKGVHTLYMNTGSTAVNFLDIRFHKKPSANDVYEDYNSEKLPFEDIASSEYKKDIAVVHELGLSGKEAGEKMYYPENLVTRARFAEMLHLVLGRAGAVDTAVPFKDVPVESELCSVVAALKQMGIISGFSDGSFRPDDFINTKDAVSAVCRMLGYDAIAKSKGGYSVGYMLVAKMEGLTDGVNVDGYLNEGNLARLIKNAIDSTCYEIKAVNTEGEANFVPNENGILSMNQNIYRAEGLVAMNSVTGVSTPETEFDDARVKIEDELFDVGETQARSLLGYKCEVYYLKENDKNTILSIYPLDTTVITDIQTNLCDIYELSSDEMVYKAIDSDREKKVTFESDCHIIYNGVALDSALEDAMGDSFRGRVRYVDNKGCKDTLFVDEYVNIVISSANKKDRFIYDQLANEKHTFTDEDKIFFTRDGATAAWGDILAGDAAMMYISKNQKGNRIARFVVTTGTISGKVKSVNDKGVVVDGKLYKVASECKDAMPLNTNLKFTLNAYDEIVSFTEDAAQESKIAWLISCGTETENAFSQTSRIRVLDTDNEIRIYELNDNCVVDGIRYKNSDAVLTDNMEGAPVRYNLNSKGYVVELDTVAIGAGGDKDGMVRAMDETDALYWSSESRIFMSSNDGLSKFIFSKDGKILAKWDDINDSENFEWVTTSALTTDGMKGEAYSLDFSEGYADVFVYSRKSGDRSNTKAFAVDMIEREMDDEGSVYDVLCGYDGITDVSYPLSDDYPEIAAQVNALKKGDWVSVTLDKKGYVLKLTPIYLISEAATLDYVYDGENKTLVPELYAGHGLDKGPKGAALLKYVYGTVVDRNGQYVLVKHEGSDVEEYLHLGLATGLRLGERGTGEIWIENKVSPDSVAIDDKVVFEISGRATRSVYIIGQ